MSRPFVSALCLLLFVTPVFASGVKAPDSDKIAELEQRAEKAQPDQQCYLFAQLVSQMGDVVDRQLASGDVHAAQQSLAKMEAYAGKIHQTINPKDKKLKESEILVRHAARRVEGMFQQAAYDQQDMFRGAMHKLNALQAELMLNVFQR
jgi:hypothetical protein